MTSAIKNICFDCADPWSLAGFWSEALGIPVDEECEPGDEEVGFPLADGRFLLFLRVPEPKTTKNRMHLCLEPDGPRDAEIARLTRLGARMVHDLRAGDGTGWAVLADPEGNELCVLRSAAERAAPSS